MNKTVLTWSVSLLVVAVVVIFLPAPGFLLSPVVAVAAWGILLRGAKKRPLVVALPSTAPAETIQTTIAPTIEIRETLPKALEAALQRFRANLELLMGFKNLVVTATEGAVLRVTEALFTLVANSKDLSAHIERSLTFITDGNSGLRRTMTNLEQQVKVFETLAIHFTQVREGLAADIGTLTKAVRSINQFSDTLSDLADQTNVLAINASIEAARVGIHGRGFAVIATQVQGLAKNSKSISETMAKTVRDVVGNVETSFHRQSQRIVDAEGLIVKSEEGLKTWAQDVGPQLVEVGTMVDKSRALAAAITGELGEVTVSLQFQDRTRQILDHMAAILSATSSEVVRSSGLDLGQIPPQRREEAYQSASGHFTVQDEWDLLSIGPSKDRHDSKKVEIF